MAEADVLSIAFMRGHPPEAARVLEALEPAQAAELLALVPARLAAPVFAAMLPNAAARSLAGLDDDKALALLGAIGTQPLVAALRHVPDARRSTLLAGLPTAAALASKMMLGYMQDSVGAWTDVDVLALPSSTQATDALERVRLVETSLQRVLATGPERRFEGWVLLSALLRAPPGATLASIMTRPQAVLSAQMPLAGALAHPGWERASTLPVVESGGRLVGVITRDALTRALRPQRARPAETLGGLLARGYWDALSGVAEAMATLLPSVPPVVKIPDEH